MATEYFLYIGHHAKSLTQYDLNLHNNLEECSCLNYISLIRFFSNYMLILTKEINVKMYKEKANDFLLKSVIPNREN